MLVSRRSIYPDGPRLLCGNSACVEEYGTQIQHLHPLEFQRTLRFEKTWTKYYVCRDGKTRPAQVRALIATFPESFLVGYPGKALEQSTEDSNQYNLRSPQEAEREGCWSRRKRPLFENKLTSLHLAG